jgi:hypothetical protein
VNARQGTVPLANRRPNRRHDHRVAHRVNPPKLGISLALTTLSPVCAFQCWRITREHRDMNCDAYAIRGYPVLWWRHP